MIKTFIIFSITNSVYDQAIFSPEISAFLKWNNSFNQSCLVQIEFIDYRKKKKLVGRSTFLVFLTAFFFFNCFVGRINLSILSFINFYSFVVSKKSSFVWKFRYGEVFSFSQLVNFWDFVKSQGVHVVLNVSDFLLPVGCLPSRILTSKQNINTPLDV